MGKKWGYGRVSSPGQQRDGNSLESQENKLIEAGADEVVLECFTLAYLLPLFTLRRARLRQQDAWSAYSRLSPFPAQVQAM